MSKQKILLLSCHETLEHDEIIMFSELGHEIFSPGSFVCNENRGNQYLRPDIPGYKPNPDILQQYHKLGAQFPGEDAKYHLTKEFVDNFDAVIVMYLPKFIMTNWEAMKHKRVIWRTIGQSITARENEIAPYRSQGLQIVRYSPREKRIPGYIGEDSIIRFYKDENYWKGWIGNKKQVVTFAQSMKQRDQACNFTFFEEVTRPFFRALYGPGNETIKLPWAHGKVPLEDMLRILQENAVYFYTGTHPASYTLNFMEAMTTGIPMVCLGPEKGNAKYFPNHDLYEIPDIIENGVNGFYSDDINELRGYINFLLSRPEAAKRIGERGRQTAIRHFGKEKIKQQWKEFLG